MDDANLACYSRQLMKRVEDHVKIALIQAHLGRVSWTETPSMALVSEVKRLLPSCIRPVDIDAEENALILLGIKADGNADEFLNCV